MFTVNISVVISVQRQCRKEGTFVTIAQCPTVASECSSVTVFFLFSLNYNDRLCGLAVRVLGYRSGGPGSIPGTTRKKEKVVGLERGPLSLMSTTEELLDRKVAAPV
jgi:hypothetical protein